MSLLFRDDYGQCPGLPILQFGPAWNGNDEQVRRGKTAGHGENAQRLINPQATMLRAISLQSYPHVIDNLFTNAYSTNISFSLASSSRYRHAIPGTVH